MINGHKHRYNRIDAGEDEYNFPTIVLGKEMIMDTKVTRQNLDVSIIDTEGETVDAFVLPKQEAAKARR